MTIITKISARPVISDKKASEAAPAKAFAFKGRNALLRNTALSCVASCAYVEGKSRADVIKHVAIALGKAPTPVELLAGKTEYVIGRVAQKLGDMAVPVTEQLAYARQLVTQYAAPVKDGTKAKALRKGQLGRRTPAQQAAIRAAEGVWYLIVGELGHGASQTQKEKNTRQAAMKGSTKRGKGDAPSHGELVASSATAPKTSDEACAMVQQLANNLLAYTKKHAGLIDAPLGMATTRYQASVAEYMKGRKPADAIAE